MVLQQPPLIEIMFMTNYIVQSQICWYNEEMISEMFTVNLIICFPPPNSKIQGN